MLICSCILSFALPEVSSLKGRRSFTNRCKEKLKALNVSVMDISSEYPKEAEFAVVFVTPDRLSAAQYRETILSLLERQFPEYPFEMSCEEF
jgi:uncharacterized protein YlxP (DUF503 family)